MKLAKVDQALQRLANQVDDAAKRTPVSISEQLATMTDITKLRDELLARATTSGDISRKGLAIQAAQLKKERARKLQIRIASVETDMAGFRAWLIERGLKSAPDLPIVVSDPDGFGLGISDKAVFLGPPEDDHLVVGFYIAMVALEKGIRWEYKSNTAPLIWTVMFYLANRYAGKEIKDIRGRLVKNEDSSRDKVIESIREEGIRGTYIELYFLFAELETVSDKVVLVAGLVNLINTWEEMTDFNKAMKLIMKGMVDAGAKEAKIESVLTTYRAIR